MTIAKTEIDAKKILAEATNTTPEKIPDGADLQNFDRWDSIAHMNLILELEQRIGRQLATDEIISIVDLESIEAILTC